jgi:hypothetical protein
MLAAAVLVELELELAGPVPGQPALDRGADEVSLSTERRHRASRDARLREATGGVTAQAHCDEEDPTEARAGRYQHHDHRTDRLRTHPRSFAGAVWTGELLLASGVEIDVFPHELDELVAAFFRLFRPTAQA